MARDLKAKIRLEGDSKGADQAIKQTERGFARLTRRVKANAIKITASLAAAAAAFKLIQDSAEEVGQRKAFERTLESQGIAADQFLAKLNEVADGQIATADIVLASNRAMKLGIQADDLPGLMATAANAAVDLGLTTTQAFNDITTGIGRASPLILDNLGIVIDAEKVYGDFATSIGKAKSELTKAERTLALTRAVTGEASDATQKFSERQDEMTRAINKGTAQLKNLKSATGLLASGLVQLVAGGAAQFINWQSLAIEGGTKLARGIVYLIRLIPGLDDKLAGAAETLRGFDDDLDSFQDKLRKFRDEITAGGAATVKAALGFEDAGDKAERAAPKVDKLTAALKGTKEEADDAKEPVDDLGESLGLVASQGDGVAGSMRNVAAALRETQSIVVATARQFDALAASAGRASAAQAAVAGGARVSGNRVFFGSGGSRFVNEPSSFSSIGGGTFTTVTPVTTQPNGRITP